MIYLFHLINYILDLIAYESSDSSISYHSDNNNNYIPNYIPNHKSNNTLNIENYVNDVKKQQQIL